MTVTRRLGLWAPPLALMGVIYLLSAQESLDSGLGWIDHVGRKLVHASEYALLCFLWWRPLRTVMDRVRALAPALVIASAYAASDEFHQQFVAGRNGTWVDWLIDTLGASLFALLVLRRTSADRVAR